MATIIITASLKYQTFTHQASDGTFSAWNVTAGMEIAATGHELLAFSLVDFQVTPAKIRAVYEEVDEAYAMTTDLSRPLLFIPFGGELLLIDGYHRLWKAATLGVRVLPMYLLTVAEADAIKLCELPRVGDRSDRPETGQSRPVPTPEYRYMRKGETRYDLCR